jgi:hypothetical protein
MKMKKQEWSTALKSFAQNQRQHNPIPNRDTLSVEEEWQCRIIGGEFISWYQQHLRGILGQRETLIIKNFDSVASMQVVICGLNNAECKANIFGVGMVKKWSCWKKISRKQSTN